MNNELSVRFPPEAGNFALFRVEQKLWSVLTLVGMLRLSALCPCGGKTYTRKNLCDFKVFHNPVKHLVQMQAYAHTDRVDVGF